MLPPHPLALIRRCRRSQSPHGEPGETERKPSVETGGPRILVRQTTSCTPQGADTTNKGRHHRSQIVKQPAQGGGENGRQTPQPQQTANRQGYEEPQR